jgi:hypothetical protein
MNNSYLEGGAIKTCALVSDRERSDSDSETDSGVNTQYVESFVRFNSLIVQVWGAG